MTTYSTLLSELEQAIAHGTARRRGEMLLQVTDLFVRGSVGLSDDEIDLFDDVLTRLALEIEVSARASLAQRLAPVAKAPVHITRILASDDEISVASPILLQSERLDDVTLVEKARTKSQDHLLAISGRKSLSENVTDVLVERGNQQVLLSTAKNPGARFSEAGFAVLVKRSDGDDALATCVGGRPDIPHHLFLVLLATASEMVRAKLIAENPQVKDEIEDAVAAAADGLRNDMRNGSADYAAAQAVVQSLHDSGRLADETIRMFAEDGKFEETVVALARSCDVPVEVVEQALIEDQSETILILAKAAKLSWATAKTLLSYRARRRGLASGKIEQNLASFERLKLSTAQQIIAFYRMRVKKRSA
jgi:uncharacterized protein (DUF2336 family)